MERAVRQKPSESLRNHSYSGNTCIDATIGVNTAHIMCSKALGDRRQHDQPQRLPLDLPLNGGHVTGTGWCTKYGDVEYAERERDTSY